MSGPFLDLPAFFAIAAAVVIGLYVALDGFDLGVGILLAATRDVSERDRMIASIAPFWDGNETWLVLGGMVLLTAFPLAFTILLPAYYVPVFLMLLGLVVRGVAFEFRPQGGRFEPVWTSLFSAGSILAAFCQGAVLGAFLHDRIVTFDGRFAGGPLDWLSPFSALAGLGVVAAYGLLGACWLVWKMDGETQDFGRRYGRAALLISGAAMVLVGVWTPLADPLVAAKWNHWPQALMFAPPAVLGAIAWVGVFVSLRGRIDWAAFVWAQLLFVCALVGLAASVWPWAVPGQLTLWQAASEHRTQVIVAWAILGILPVILAYMGFGYWTFRGKARPDGY